MRDIRETVRLQRGTEGGQGGTEMQFSRQTASRARQLDRLMPDGDGGIRTEKRGRG